MTARFPRLVQGRVAELNQFYGLKFVYFTNSTYSYNTISEQIYVMKLRCVVVVLISCINVSYTCPSGCSCSANKVECQERNLAAIPSGTPFTTEYL